MKLSSDCPQEAVETPRFGAHGDDLGLARVSVSPLGHRCAASSLIRSPVFSLFPINAKLMLSSCSSHSLASPQGPSTASYVLSLPLESITLTFRITFSLLSIQGFVIQYLVHECLISPQTL